MRKDGSSPSAISYNESTSLVCVTIEGHRGREEDPEHDASMAHNLDGP